MRFIHVIVAATALFTSTAALAGDHSNLEEGLPTQVEDAYATEYLNREAQLAFGYFRAKEKADKNQLLAYPRLEFSFARNWQFRLGAPFNFDTTSIHRTDGQIETELFYNFNTEDIVLPAFALSGRMRYPVDLESEGLDSQVKLILTKTIIRQVRGQLHVNVMWQHQYDTPKPSEYPHKNGYVAILGYSQRLTTSTVLVFDFLREQAIRREKIQNRIELGLRFQATPLTVLSLGAAAGIEQDSDRARVIGAVQHSF